MDAAKQKNRINIIGFILVFLLNFFSIITFHIFGIIPPYLSELGASKSYIGLFMNTNALMLVFYVLLFGHLANRIKKKRFLTGGFFILFISMAGMYLFHSNLVILVFLKILSGISFAFSFTMTFSIAHELVPDDKRTGFIAIFGISGLAATPVGALISEGVSKNFGPPYLFVVAAGVALIAIIISRIIYDPSERRLGDTPARKVPLKEFFSNRAFWHLLALAFLFGGTYAAFSTYIPNFSKEKLGEANISNFFIAFSTTAVLIRLLFFKLFDKVSRKRLFLIAFISGLCGMVFIQFLSAKWMLLFIGFFYGVCHSILFPTLSAEFVQKAPADAKAPATNMFLAVKLFGALSISIFLGFLGDIFGSSIIFMAMTLGILAALAIILTRVKN